MEASDEVGVDAQLVPEDFATISWIIVNEKMSWGSPLKASLDRMEVANSSRPSLTMNCKMQVHGYFLVRGGKVFRVEKLNHRPPGGRMPPE